MDIPADSHGRLDGLHIALFYKKVFDLLVPSPRVQPAAPWGLQVQHTNPTELEGCAGSARGHPPEKKRTARVGTDHMAQRFEVILW